MSSNLVDSMMQELEMNNSQQDMNYAPDPSMMHPQLQSQSQLQPQMNQMMNQSQQPMYMNNVNYYPTDQIQAPTMQPKYNMDQTITTQSPEMSEMDAPNLENYGMEDEESTLNWLDFILNEAKAPLIVMALAFVMSMPQINILFTNTLSKFTNNMLYMNLIRSLLIAVVFYVIIKLLS